MSPNKLVECTLPVLPVKDLASSIRFYTDTLGFMVDWGGEPGRKICSVSRDGCHIMLSQDLTSAAIPQIGIRIIGLEDASLFDRWRESGVTVLQGPKNWSWAYEMKFEDIDGNVLWVGTEPLGDQPFVDGIKG